MTPAALPPGPCQPDGRNAGVAGGVAAQAPRRNELSAFDAEIARRTFRIATLVCAFGAAVFALLYHAVGPQAFILPNALGAVALALNAAIRRPDPGPQIWIALTTGMAMFGWQLVLVGHVDNGLTLWFVVPCVVTMQLGARRVAIYTLAMSLAIVLGVALAARLGWLHGEVKIADGDLLMSASIVGVLALCSSFAVMAFRARQRLVREIELRNAELGAALEDARLARNAAVEASQAKERFFANVTHEIRTPLAGIAGSAELLQHTALSTEQQPLAGALATSTQRLLELVNAMLDHAKLAAGHVAVERGALDLGHLMADLEGLYRAQAAEKGLALSFRLEPDPAPWVETDGLKLAQIAGNLIGNAIKFTPQGSVSVTLACTEDHPGSPGLRLRLSVVDTGIGVTEAQQASIFEPFVQGDAAIARAFGGTGLGLAIARQLADLLHGSLAVRSRPGEGSHFELVLPVGRASAPPPPPPPAPPADAPPAGLQVLLVEDNAINRLIASAMLQALGVAHELAEDGAAAVAAAQARHFDLVLMDLQMPGLDGIEATRRIRAGESAAGRERTPIVALTGNSPDDYGEACGAAGMDGYLVKPVQLDALRALLVSLALRR